MSHLIGKWKSVFHALNKDTLWKPSRNRPGYSNTAIRHTACQIIPLYWLTGWNYPQMTKRWRTSAISLIHTLLLIQFLWKQFHITPGYWQMEYSIRSYLTPIYQIYNLAPRLHFLVFQMELLHIHPWNGHAKDLFIYLFPWLQCEITNRCPWTRSIQVYSQSCSLVSSHLSLVQSWLRPIFFPFCSVCKSALI